MNNCDEFLPINRYDMEAKGWEKVDFILVTGDAYIDHPSFGGPLIARVLERAGYKVGIIAQPDWKDLKDIKKLGKPRLGFLVTSGNMDSMVNHYSVGKKRRKKDMYSPDGKMGLRPDRAVIVYTNLIKQAYKDAPVIIGGIEASLRRLAHYDYWSNQLRRSVLYDSGADLLVYGMAENQILEIAEYLNNGIDIQYIQHVKGTVFTVASKENVYDYIELPSYKEVSESKNVFAEYFKIFYDNQDPILGKTLVQEHDKGYIVQNSPIMPLNQEELDYIYELPFTR
ncbi:MAG: YgiQ family radical SAM protein, partial [Clostridiales bacterium]|nr:YgiQ family radical SAM protein [Clostridiales bacterium]